MKIAVEQQRKIHRLRPCNSCGKLYFYALPSRPGKFCSTRCSANTTGNLSYRIPRGHKPWNAGISGYRYGHTKNRIPVTCRLCDKVFFVLPSQNSRIYCSAECSGKVAKNTGKRHSVEAKKKMSLAKIGKHISPATEFKRDPNRPERLYIRGSSAYSRWRKAVFERDNYTCRFCGKRGGRIDADHIKTFFLYPELRLDVNNGRTLCEECHRRTPTYRMNNYVQTKLHEEGIL